MDRQDLNTPECYVRETPLPPKVKRCLDTPSGSNLGREGEYPHLPGKMWVSHNITGEERGSLADKSWGTTVAGRKAAHEQ